MPEHRPASLTGVCVLVTRPPHQATALRELIVAHGGSVALFPVLDIVPLAPGPVMLQSIANLARFDIAIFISPNAVRYAFNDLLTRQSLPAHLATGAVGERTAAELRNRGIRVDLCPAERFDSEGLLALPELQHIKTLKIIIFRGVGGRETLGDELAQRGAHVEYAEVYRRVRPATDLAPLLHIRHQPPIDVVSVTSNEGLTNLVALAGTEGYTRLLQLPLAVISTRTAMLARKLGFHYPATVCSQASDDAMLAAIMDAARGTRPHE